MSDIPYLKIKNAVVCDDIRREDNGKELLIGVYSGGIVVPQFPAPLVLAYWVQFDAPKPADNVDVEFRLLGGPETQFFSGRTGIKLLRAGPGSMALGQAPVFLQIPSTLTLQLKQADSDWETVHEITVEKGPMPPGLAGIRKTVALAEPAPAT